jgi:hypothetical protein
VEERKIIEKILRILLEKFDKILITIKEEKDLPSLILDELMGSLHLYEKTLIGLCLPKRNILKLKPMQEVGGDEEVALDTTLELELLVTHGKETLEKKAQN